MAAVRQCPTARATSPPVIRTQTPGPAPSLPHPLDEPLRPRRTKTAPGILFNRQRPNDHLLFSPSTGDSTSRVLATLNPHGITRLLQSYPDKDFVNVLTSIARSGVRLGYEGSVSAQVRRSNHSSSIINAAVISDSILSELQKGRIREITSLPEHYFCSPIGLVPKTSDGVQTGWRMIFDLSSPIGNSVNDGIPKEYGSIVYETLADAIRLVAKTGRGAIMMKRDLKSAFRHIPVCQSDHWLMIFEWERKFYVDMFLPFGLRTAPRIFNLFSEALHWVFETSHGWNLTHYLDDFFVVFPPETNIAPHSQVFDEVINTMGLTKAVEKDSHGTTVTHLGFEFDSINMEVCLPPNKKLRAMQAVKRLLHASSISFTELEEVLGFLSHCCQVVPLGRPFLRQLFSLLRRAKSPFKSSRTRITSSAKSDIRWWVIFLSSWSSISMIKLSRVNHDVATDASGAKGIGGVCRRIIFSDRVPARHRRKHINWKEAFAILHAFVLWHKHWAGGRLRLACDNAAVVEAVNKRSIRGETIRPLQLIFLIAAVFDIEITAFWIPSEENIVADAASRHDFKKLANLGFQVSSLRNRTPDTKMSTLRQRLFTFFTIPSPLRRGKTTIPPATRMSPFARSIAIPPSPSLSKLSPIGSPHSCRKPNQRPRSHTSKRCALLPSNLASTYQSLTIPELISSSGEGNVAMAKVPSDCDFPSRRQSSNRSPDSSTKMTSTRSTSKRRSAWHLPLFFDLVSLHGTAGINRQQSTTFPGATSCSTPTTQPPLHFQLPKLTPFAKVSQSNLPHARRPTYALSEVSGNLSTTFPAAHPTHCSHELTDHSTGNTLSVESNRFSSVREFQ
jgi:hypothetical protein